MQEEIISLETAKLAKEKGFEIKTKHWYDQTHALNPMKGARGAMVYENIGYAPTQSLLQKWLREVHGIHIIIEAEVDMDSVDIGFIYILKDLPDSTTINKAKNKELGEDWDLFLRSECITDPSDSIIYETYEEALEEGLQKALEFLKNA